MGDITGFQIFSIAAISFNILVTIGGFAWFGGKLTGRFEGHEMLDTERFKNLTEMLNKR